MNKHSVILLTPIFKLGFHSVHDDLFPKWSSGRGVKESNPRSNPFRGHR